MSMITVRLPESLHAALSDAVKSDGVSIDQFISLAIAEKIAVIKTANYIETRTNRSDRATFFVAMDTISDEKPDTEQDLLPY